MIAIVDYGVGNLFSLECSLKKIGADTVVTGDAAEIARAEKIILPGVGAFADAIKKLRERMIGIAMEITALSHDEAEKLLLENEFSIPKAVESFKNI